MVLQQCQDRWSRVAHLCFCVHIYCLNCINKEGQRFKPFLAETLSQTKSSFPDQTKKKVQNGMQAALLDYVRKNYLGSAFFWHNRLLRIIWKVIRPLLIEGQGVRGLKPQNIRHAKTERGVKLSCGSLRVATSSFN